MIRRRIKVKIKKNKKVERRVGPLQKRGVPFQLSTLQVRAVQLKMLVISNNEDRNPHQMGGNKAEVKVGDDRRVTKESQNMMHKRIKTTLKAEKSFISP